MGNLTRAGFRRKLSIANGYLETVNKLDSESPTLLLGNCERQIITVLLAGSVRLPSRHCSLRDPVKSGHPQRKRGYWGRACCPRPAMFQITAVDSPPSGQGPPGPPPLRATALNPQALRSLNLEQCSHYNILGGSSSPLLLESRPPACVLHE